MKEYDKIPAQAVVEVTTSWGRTCLREIGRDLKEGTVLDGYYYPVSKAFDFYWKGEGAMLWIGDNGRLVSLGEGQEHKYMMLGRMLSDCKYFLRNPYERHLYFPSIARHCKEMRQYWLELNIKPEWLSYKQIGKLEHKMNRMKTKLDRQFKKTDMENRRNIKRTKKGAGATVKLVGIQIDNDLLPFLNALPNKSRFINDLLRKKFFGK